MEGRAGFFTLLLLLILAPSINPLPAASDDPAVDRRLFVAEDWMGRGIETLKDLPVELYMRMTPYFLVSVSPVHRPAIEERGFACREILRVVDDEGNPVFLLTRPAGAETGNPPSTGEVLYQGGDWFLVRAPQGAVSRFGREGFQVSAVPLRPLPLEISKNTTPSFSKGASLSHVARQKAAVSDSTILNYLQRLQDFQTRYSYADSVLAAAEWVHDRFVEFGFTDVEYDSFWFDGTWQRNIVATKPGMLNPDKVILIGGHYDSVVYSDTCSPYTWAPGADDNGSGTALTIDMARILAGEAFDRTLKFVTFAAEEQGLHGSWHFAEEAYNSGMDIELMINMDMVGNLADAYLDVDIKTDDPSMGYARLMRQVARDSTDLIPIIGYSGSGSDHYPFMQYGFNHVFAAEGDFSRHWHRCSDIVENIDIPYLVQVEGMVLPTVVIVANAKAIDVETDCPIDSVAPGGTVPFSVTVTNGTDSTVTFDLTLWIERVGGWEIPFFGPRTMTLDGGGGFTRNPSIGVPVNTQPGDYLITLEAVSLAGELIDRDSFPVTVVGLGARAVREGGMLHLEGM